MKNKIVQICKIPLFLIPFKSKTVIITYMLYNQSMHFSKRDSHKKFILKKPHQKQMNNTCKLFT